MSIEAWLAFVAASAILLVIPGPTILLVVGITLSNGRRAGLATVPGVVLGDAVAMTASLAGLGALLAASATAFTILKFIGAAYLVFLGIRMWLAPPTTLAATPASHAHHRRRAFIVTALNPKGIAFFVAFVPQFVDPAGDVLLQLVIMQVTFLALAGTGATLYTLLASRARQFATSPPAQKVVARVGGSALIGAGALTAAARHG